MTETVTFQGGPNGSGYGWGGDRLGEPRRFDVSDQKERPEREGSLEDGSTGFAELGDLLRSGFKDAGEGPAAGAELRSAWSGFVDAARDLGQALAATANDPEVRATVKNAVQSLVDTVGTAARDAADTVGTAARDAAGTVGTAARDAAGTAAERVRQTAERRKAETGDTDGDVEPTTRPIVTCSWLADHLDDPDVRIVDTRWFLGQPGAGQVRYEENHLPGAVFLDLDDDLAASEGPGRHPLLSPEDLADLLGRHGIGNRHHVVVYDQGPGAIAARLWWMLRSVGHERVSVLDGGYERWSGQSHPLTADPPDIVPTTYETGEGPTLAVDRDQLLARLGTAQVIDAREPERYRGETEPIDSVAGHIPTALSAPTADNVGPDGTFKPAHVLAAQFSEMGLDPDTPVVSYCGSGVTACHNLLALHIAGYPEGILYPGSWSDWSATGMPVAVGPDPGPPPERQQES